MARRKRSRRPLLPGPVAGVSASSFRQRPDGEVVLRVVPRSQVLERVRGAVLTGRAPAGATSVRVAVVVQRTGSPPRSFRLERRLPVGPDGAFSIRLAQPAPAREAGFRILGPWLLEADGRRALVSLTEADVRGGAVVGVEWR